MNNTGENTEGLRKIIDMTRQMSIILLVLHYYVYCYGAFKQWGLSHPVSDKFLLNLNYTGLFNHNYTSKLAALILLLISLIGSRGKKDDTLKWSVAFRTSGFGLLLYVLSYFLLSINASHVVITVLYITVTTLGYVMVLRGGALLSRILQLKFKGDIFNKLNESFPQEERLLENEYSVNLPARYNLRGKICKSWINIINPFRAFLVVGTPGAGKSYFVIRHVITQHIKKGFTMFVYDFKYDDLTRIVYNTLQQNLSAYQVKPKFCVINFDDLSQTHRCNPLEPGRMDDITDAAESSRTIMLGLNREWIKKQGDFFVESPINFVTAIIWFLKKYRKGVYCTLPHVIELMQVEYHDLFSVLRTEPEIEVLINPFVSAYKNRATDQLEGQIASAKISMARLASPQLYFVLSGNDFTLDLNNPEEPKIICMGNNPQKQQTYGAVLSLYISRMIKLVNQKNKIKSSLVFDEFPTIYFNGIDSLIATARSNKVATCLGMQDYSQLKKDYGREQAEVIMNIVGNIISGQVVGDTAKQLSERFGKIMQERESVSINSMDTSISKSTQLESAIPPSKISGLSSGEFVGMVADDPMQKIELKTFHAEIINDHDAIKQEEDQYLPIPKIRDISVSLIEQNYLEIKRDIVQLIDTEIERMMDSPDLANFILKKVI
ncbi:type IV secretory system conjugative DNA transfer VirD4/TraG family protein [Mucilaginibacter gracilis]|uniref:Type IV secretory system conjugative DNA transfer VirD4/TraG family protein n=1 Tax=Mucilaginibacter gracilis TaxID=423350 RepID=A0A495IXD7_9SPHI|nr:conjugal transfer protein MobC [Mucilaginibacter gracilis]RKR80718.1 type IV secretory system conjugative DNA transfer VirD4/TraG family protein [Mucilaginibacter gracilis]